MTRDPDWKDPSVVAMWAARRVVEAGEGRWLWLRAGAMGAAPDWRLTEREVAPRAGIGWKLVERVTLESAEAIYGGDWWSLWRLACAAGKVAGETAA